LFPLPSGNLPEAAGVAAVICALFAGFAVFGLVVRLRQTPAVYADGWSPPRRKFPGRARDRSFIRWEDTVLLVLDNVLRGMFVPSGGPLLLEYPGYAKVAVHLRNGEVVRMTLQDLGPVFPVLARRIPVRFQ